MIKLTSIVRVINIRNLKTRIEGYGYRYSLKQYVLVLGLEMFLVILLGKLNYLSMQGIFVLLGAIVIMTPCLIIEQFRYLFEQSLFIMVTEYMEQMMYAFSRHPKIISALEEVEESSEGVIREEISAMIDALFGEEELSYQRVFRKFEERYPCDRLRIMHDFFIKVEQMGGNYQTALFVLIEDLKLYKERVYLFQKERTAMIQKINMSIVAVLSLCTVLFRVLSQDDSMRTPLNGTAYQCASTVLFLVFYFLIIFTQVKLKGSWFGNRKYMSEKEIIRDWKHVREDAAHYPRARRRLEREVEKQFPGWLRIMTLGLSSDNVYRSLVGSLDSVPLVMEQDMKTLVSELVHDPVSMRPYNHFLQDLSVPEVRSTMKMFYAYTNTGTEDAKSQLQAIMQRNMVLTDRGERMENEDHLAKYQFLFYMPMFLGTAKIMMDMSVLFVVMFQLWGQL